MPLHLSNLKPASAAMACSLLFAVAACGGEKAAEERAEENANASQNGAAAESAEVSAAAADEVDAAMEAAQEALSTAEEEAADAMENPQHTVDEMLKAAGETPESAAMKLANVTSDAFAAEAGIVQAVAVEGVSTAQLIKASAEETAETGVAVPAGDAAAGRRVFVKCMACHTVQEGQHRVGPSLYGIVGKTAGTVEGFRNYSPANRDSGVTWTPEVLFDYLESPQTFMPGTRMIFAGLPSEKERADLIAYLESASQ